jgi:hypothetical protein
LYRLVRFIGLGSIKSHAPYRIAMRITTMTLYYNYTISFKKKKKKD